MIVYIQLAEGRDVFFDPNSKKELREGEVGAFAYNSHIYNRLRAGHIIEVTEQDYLDYLASIPSPLPSPMGSVLIYAAQDEAQRLTYTHIKLGDEVKQDDGTVWKLIALPATEVENWLQVGGGTFEGGAITWNTISGKPNTFTPSTHAHSPSEVGLGNVNNTSDADKPISTATEIALSALQSQIQGIEVGNVQAPTQSTLQAWAGKFDKSYAIGTKQNPVSGAIPNPDFSGAVIGSVVTIIHQDSTAPTFPSAEVLDSISNYSPNILNLIRLEYLGNSEVLGQIVQLPTPISTNPELVPTGYNMADANTNGRADNVIAGGSNTSSVPTFAVINDNQNGFSGGYQRVSATATANSCFTSILVDAVHNASQNLKANTAYRIKLKYRASFGIRLQQSGGSVWQSLSNNTGGSVSAGALLLSLNTGNAVEVEVDILTNATVENMVQVRFQSNQSSPQFFEFQISIVEI